MAHPSQKTGSKVEQGGLNRDRLYQRNRAQLKAAPGLHFCHICGQQIDMTLKFPHPGSWSCQHITPRSMGGSSEMDNLAEAHKRCQDKEGNALAGRAFLGGGSQAPLPRRLRQSRVWHD